VGRLTSTTFCMLGTSFSVSGGIFHRRIHFFLSFICTCSSKLCLSSPPYRFYWQLWRDRVADMTHRQTDGSGYRLTPMIDSTDRALQYAARVTFLKSRSHYHCLPVANRLLYKFNCCWSISSALYFLSRLGLSLTCCKYVYASRWHARTLMLPWGVIAIIVNVAKSL